MKKRVNKKKSLYMQRESKGNEKESQKSARINPLIPGVNDE